MGNDDFVHLYKKPALMPNNMKIVLVNPYRFVEEENVWGTVNSITPPLGLAILAAIAERNGCHVSIVDAAAEGFANASQILDFIPTDVTHVGLSATTPEIYAAKEIISLLRLKRKAQIILGGVHPTIFHEQLVSSDEADIVFRGESEVSFDEFTRMIPLSQIKGVTWRDSSGETIVNPDQDKLADLDQIPSPAYSMLPMERYRSALGAAIHSPSLGMITSRGCPGKCTFCYSGMFGSKIRTMSAKNMVEQIKHLVESYGIREISFYDDTFTANRRRVEEFCNLLIEHDIKISWSCFARVDTVSQDLLNLMKRASCHQISFGIESVDKKILENVNKRISTKKIERAIEQSKRAKIDVRGAFMLGNIGDTTDTMSATIDYAIKLGIKYAIFNITTPFPGTVLYEQAKKANYILHQDWKRYDLAHPILEMPGLPASTVGEYYNIAYRRFYMRPRYIWKLLFGLRSWYEFKLYVRAFFGIFAISFSKKSRD